MSGRCYALVNARNPDLHAFGSNAVLYWEAIRLASEVARVFDFEGSMLQPIEHFVRGFGGRRIEYLSISRSGIRAKSLLAARSARQTLRRVGRHPIVVDPSGKDA